MDIGGSPYILSRYMGNNHRRLFISDRWPTWISSMSIYRVEVLMRSRSVPHGTPDVSYENSLPSQIPEGLNSGDGGNMGDECKIVGGAIGARGSEICDSSLVALYACMTFIYGSLWKGEMTSEAKRSLDKSSEGSEEMFLGEAGNSLVKPGYS
ncbi:hypothetical protein Tco_0540797 [Tanacetum coccineum]